MTAAALLTALLLRFALPPEKAPGVDTSRPPSRRPSGPAKP